VTASRPRLGISTASWLIKSDTPQPSQHLPEPTHNGAIMPIQSDAGQPGYRTGGPGWR